MNKKENCFWCGCEIKGIPNYIKPFGYVCDKDYVEMGYNVENKCVYREELL